MTDATLPPAGRLFKIAITGLAVSIVLLVPIAVYGFVTLPDDDPFVQIIGTSVLLVVCFGAFTGSGFVLRRGKGRISQPVSIFLMISGFALTTAFMWLERSLRFDVEQIVIAFGVMSLATGGGLAYSGLFGLFRPQSRLLWLVKHLALACLWCFVVLLSCIVLLDVLDEAPAAIVLAPLLGASSVGVLIGTVVVPIAALSRANRRELPKETVDARLSIEMACPKCGHRQRLGQGAVRCAHCRARLFIDLEEPRCECGYLLYQLASDRCPECGREVPEEWRGVRGGASPAL